MSKVAKRLQENYSSTLIPCNKVWTGTKPAEPNSLNRLFTTPRSSFSASCVTPMLGNTFKIF